MRRKDLLDYKKDYDDIDIPMDELNTNIMQGIERGRQEMNTAKNKNLYNGLLKTCAAVVISLGALTAGVNMSPAFADALKEIPVLGELVKVLQFTDGTSEGGEITDGSDISILKSFEERGYENILIGFNQGEQGQDIAGSYKLTYNENPYTMTVEIGGARRFSAMDSFDEIKKSKNVKDVYQVITLDDSLIRFVIEFEGPMEYHAKELKNPASLVIATKPISASQKSLYSVRTDSAPMNEGLAYVEEELYNVKDLDIRYLRDEKDLFFIEVQNFNNRADAEKLMENLNKKLSSKLTVEKRAATDLPKSIGNAKKEVVKEEEKIVEKNTQTADKYDVAITGIGYGSLIISDDGLKVLGEEGNSIHVFKYSSSSFKKTMGEASFNLTVKDNNKTMSFSGVYSDFFDELSKHSDVK